MPGVPSNKACERCKKRHIKCDETRPHCQRCADAGVQCPGFVQTRKFIDQGASVRRRYAPYQESVPKPGSGRSTPRPAKNHHPESEPSEGSGPERQAQSRSQSPPLSTDIGNRAGIRPAAPELGTSSLISPFQDSDGDVAYRPGNDQLLAPVPWHESSERLNPTSTIVNYGTDAGVIADESQPQPSPAGPPLPRTRSPSDHGEREQFQDIFSELMTGTEHEICFLVRHYCEVLASWLDISDTAKFFTASVPVRAIDEQSLRFAMAAFSAKHLATMKGVKTCAVAGMFTSPATMETYPNTEQVDWPLKAANYYYLAVSHMNAPISDYAAVSTSDVLEPPISVVNRWLNLQLRQTARDPDGTDRTWKTTENLLASSTILTLYKILDEPGENWQSYLSGVRPLFSQLLDLSGQLGGDSNQFSPGTTAAFWNFARLDYLASYYNRLPTHLDPDHFALWRAAGLSLDDQGTLYSPETVQRTHAFLREDIAANALTRLLNKLTNFLAASKKSQLEHWVGGGTSPEMASSRSSSHSPDSHPTSSTWLKLSFEFQSWVERIPETFRPCLRLERPKPFPAFPEIFYSLTSCAAAMQQYHFGRLALSLNRPSDDVAGPSSSFDRLQSYRDLTKEVDHRCREICGIALGRPQSGARVQMITLLYAVGQCLEKPGERQVVIDLLRGIEADLGWSTVTQVQKLQR
ncbi:hypothetical protein BJX76DRAFT_258770 [Aspergillus varians]